MHGASLKTAFLWSMIVSLSLAALAGIVALLLPDLIGADEEILISTVIFGLFSLIALCSAIVLEKRRLVTLMWIGIGSGALSLAGWLALVWFERQMVYDVETNIVRTAGMFSTVAVLMAQCGLLALPRMVGRWAVSIRRGTFAVSIALAVVIILMIWWFEFFEDFIDDEVIARGMGVLGILAACGTIITPIVWKVQAVQAQSSATSIPSRVRIDVICPRCHARQTLRTGRGKCAECGLRITIDVEEPHCICGYSLYQLKSDRCPECGRAVPETDRWAAGEDTGPTVCAADDPAQSKDA